MKSYGLQIKPVEVCALLAICGLWLLAASLHEIILDGAASMGAVVIAWSCVNDAYLSGARLHAFLLCAILLSTFLLSLFIH